MTPAHSPARPAFRTMAGPLARSTTGSAAVEFAVAAPLVLATVLAAFVTSAYLSVGNSLATGADEAARLAAVYPLATDADIKTRFTASATFTPDPGRLTVDVARAPVDSAVNRITVTGSYPVSLGFLGLAPATVTVRRSRSVYVSAS